MGCSGSKEDVVSQPTDVKHAGAAQQAQTSRAHALAPVPARDLGRLDDIIAAEFDIKVVAGRNLAPKDGGGLMGGERTSDPYCVIRYRKLAEKSAYVAKNLNPTWDWSVKFHLQGRDFRPKSLATDVIRVCVYDYDKGLFDSDDPMGAVLLPISALLSGRVIDAWLPVQSVPGCRNATGELHVIVSAAVRRALSLKSQDSMPINDSQIGVALGWDLIGGRTAIDLDTSCVAMSDRGQVLLRECAYFAQLRSASGAITHTGDEREGDEDLGQGDDEIIVIDLAHVPREVKALFCIATLATEGRSFADVKSARMRLTDWNTGIERCRFYPASKGAHTALIMCRIVRLGHSGQAAADWSIQIIDSFDHTARDFGTLVPEMK
mmetsp:Transcript_56767/g.112720  ORF Transcript_56767/g.112720 Transcript_56767/m.112720 type:complete len:378 (+) Transcript_56767:11-1144(+)